MVNKAVEMVLNIIIIIIIITITIIVFIGIYFSPLGKTYLLKRG